MLFAGDWIRSDLSLLWRNDKLKHVGHGRRISDQGLSTASGLLGGSGSSPKSWTSCSKVSFSSSFKSRNFAPKPFASCNELCTTSTCRIRLRGIQKRMRTTCPGLTFRRPSILTAHPKTVRLMIVPVKGQSFVNPHFTSIEVFTLRARLGMFDI